MTRTAFITGVSSGIGAALSSAYREKGVHVYGLSRRSPGALAGMKHFAFRNVDLSEFERVPAALKELLGGVDHIDLVVLNAGILGRIADLADTPVPEMQHVLQVNLWANKVILDTLFKMGIPVLQVVAISSGAAVKANRGWNAYAISKAALNMLIALYAAERAETHFCALAPGIVDTAMQDQISELPEDSRFSSLEVLRAAKGTPAMPRPEEAAPKIMETIEKARDYPSGSFLDVRSIHGAGGILRPDSA